MSFFLSLSTFILCIKMKATTAIPLLAALAAQAHPIQDGSKEAAVQFGTCKFDRTTAFNTLSASNSPVSRRAAGNSTSTWDPPSSLSAALDEVWEHEISTYGGDPLTFKNYGEMQSISCSKRGDSLS